MQQPPLLDKSTEHRKHLLLVWNNIHTAQKSHYFQCSRTLGPDWKKEVSLHALHIFPCFRRSKPDMLNELSFKGQTCLSQVDFIWKPTDPQEDQQQQNSCPWSGREQSKEQLPLLWPLPAEIKPQITETTCASLQIHCCRLSSGYTRVPWHQVHCSSLSLHETRTLSRLSGQSQTAQLQGTTVPPSPVAQNHQSVTVHFT